MLVKLLLELLDLIPAGAAAVSSILKELHSSDDTGQKVASIAATARQIVAVADTLTEGNSKPTE